MSYYKFINKKTFELNSKEILAIFNFIQNEWKIGKKIIMKLLSNYHYDDVHFFVYKNNTIVGYANLIKKNNLRKIYFIDYLIIKKIFKKKKIGSNLLNYINSFLAKKKLLVYLHCLPHIQKFYSHNFWSILTSKDYLFYYLKKHNHICMKFKLNF